MSDELFWNEKAEIHLLECTEDINYIVRQYKAEKNPIRRQVLRVAFSYASKRRQSIIMKYKDF